MRVAICGGGLQGVELCWLAGKAGWDCLLADRRSDPPALHLATRFVQGDLTRIEGALAEALAAVDLVIPALEDDAALHALGAWCADKNKPFAFDPEAYAVSSSKIRSRELFLRCQTPIPTPFAGRNFPIIAKPSRASGSRGVRLLHDTTELCAYLPQGFDTPEWIFEAYCPGPSFSLEVCGTPGAYRVFQVTELLMDEVFDCRGVLAPAQAAPSVIADMESELLRLAEALSLRGLMDLEVILSPEGVRVLEIDARFPSQTPTAVWLSTGINLAEHLAACFVRHEPAAARSRFRYARYEHVLYENGVLKEQGEHVMSRFGPLLPLHNFLGADEMLLGGATPDDWSGPWAATLLFVDDDEQNLLARRKACLDALRERGNR